MFAAAGLCGSLVLALIIAIASQSNTAPGEHWGRLTAAIELWRDAFDRNPHLTELGLNLARGRCAVGDATGARAVLQKALAHNPDSGAARQLLAVLTDGSCRRQ